MKNTYKNLALGGFLTVFAALTAVPSLAQDVCKDVDANTALYKKYTDNYAGPELTKIETAIAAAEEYIQKYEPCKDDKGAPTFADQVNYFKGALPERKEFVAKAKTAADDKKMYDRFNAAIGAKPANVGEIIESGKVILAKYPDNEDSLDVNIVLASAAFDEFNAKGTSAAYNADLVAYAKKAVQLIEAGKTSRSKIYGYQKNGNIYSLGTKANALGVLNYSIAKALLNDPATKKDAVAYFYKTSQNESNVGKDPLIYRAIGSNYLDEFLRLDTERKAEITANGKGTEDTPKSLELEAMQRGYAERAIEAYARAYKIAKADPKQKATADAVATTLKQLYEFRNEGKTLDNMDAYVTTVAAKTLTDPATTVAPIAVEVPATTPPTSGSTTTPPTTTPATTTPTTTAPATKPATTPAKPVTPTKPATANTEADSTATTKAKAKKPTPKKKGTR